MPHGFAHSPAVLQWCQELRANPLPQSCWCPTLRGETHPTKTYRYNCCQHTHPIDKWARDGHGNATFDSQHGQDWWLQTNLIATGLHRLWRGDRRHGTYVDLATNDPIFRSSTFYLDACLGWKGVCVEANPQHYYHIWQQRSCTLVPACASHTRKRIPFQVNAGEASGGSSHVGEARKGASWSLKSRETSVPCDTLTRMLERSGLSHIDVLSLDIEGHEASALAGLNFSRITVNVIITEASCKARAKHHNRVACELLTSAGFRPVPDQNIHDTVWTRQPLPSAPQRFQCRPPSEAGGCRGWDYRGASEYDDL